MKARHTSQVGQAAARVGGSRDHLRDRHRQEGTGATTTWDLRENSVHGRPDGEAPRWGDPLLWVGPVRAVQSSPVH